MTLFCDFPAFLCKYFIPDLVEFYLKFSVPCVVFRIRLCFFDINFRAVKPRAKLAGKEICPGYPDSANGIQLVCVK